MPGSLIVYLKGMRIMMFQLSGFYSKVWGLVVWSRPWGVWGSGSSGFRGFFGFGCGPLGFWAFRV